MGQILSAPVTEKHTTAGGNGFLEYAASGMQGWRTAMEDAHTTELDLDGNEGVHFFAVYDGHGGSIAAKFAGQNTHQILISDKAFKEKRYAEALTSTFLTVDIAMRHAYKAMLNVCGCTAVAALILPTQVYVANAGDSRALISTKGVAKPLSYDHKPNNPKELERISKAGGFVHFGRVNGNLALSRAMGDFDFKRSEKLDATQQVVTVDPDIIVHDLTSDDEFILLACDGVWDCMTNQDVVDFIRPRIANNEPYPQIVEALLDNCLANESDATGIGSDNMTAVLVALNPEAETRARCARPAQAIKPSSLVAPPVVEEEEFAQGRATISVSTFAIESNREQARDPAFVEEVLASLETPGGQRRLAEVVAAAMEDNADFTLPSDIPDSFEEAMLEDTELREKEDNEEDEEEDDEQKEDEDEDEKQEKKDDDDE